MVSVEPRVWQVGGEGAAEYISWVLTMLLRVETDSTAVMGAVRRSFVEIYAHFDRDSVSPLREVAEEDLGDFSAGVWSCMRVREGVLLHVYDCDDLPRVMPVLTERLAVNGISGSIALWELPRVEEPPGRADLLACRVSVRGERLHQGARTYRWLPDPAAHRQFLALAEQWCRSPKGSLCSVRSATPAVRVGPEEVVSDRLSEAFAAHEHSSLMAVSDAGLRLCTARPASGRVALVVAASSGERDWWRPALAELTALLRASADLLVYAHIRRGWSLIDALEGDELGGDWPARDPQEPRMRVFSSTAFDDLLAPDVFGVQLLGPGYAGRIAHDRDWRFSPVGVDRTLLEHEHPDKWFDTPLIPYGARVSAPDLLVHARAVFEDLLFRPGVLPSFGFPDAELLIDQYPKREKC